MFPSKTNPRNFPQFEHARLAAWLAQHWGNERFSLPAIERDILVRGVMLHDRGYGYLDNAPLLDLPVQAWLEIMRAGIEEQDSFEVDRIVHLHIRRLLDFQPEGAALAAALQERLDAEIEDWPHWRAVDSITNLCDRLSFEMCFEAQTSKTLRLPVRPGLAEVEFRYGLREPGVVFCDPWPFGGESVAGQLVGFRRSEYPTNLVPEVVNYLVIPA